MTTFVPSMTKVVLSGTVLATRVRVFFSYVGLRGKVEENKSVIMVYVTIMQHSGPQMQNN